MLDRLSTEDTQRIARDKVMEIAEQIYANEINDNVPDLDNCGRPTREYLQRFDYLSDNLKNAVKRAATALQHDLKDIGVEMNTWNCENELYDALKCFTK